MNHDHIRILLIEDNSMDAEIFQELLEPSTQTTYDVIWVDRLSRSLEHLKKVDVIFLDLSLPDSYGLNTYQTLNQYTLTIPIIILSGLNDEALAIEAVRKGAQDYLMKGEIRSQSLERSIHYAIERKRISEELKYRKEQMENELIDAQFTQNALLPQVIPQLENTRITTQYIPLIQVSGDLYDVVTLDKDRLGILIADVSGHGVSAALLGAMVSLTFKNANAFYPSPGKVLQFMDEALYKKFPDGKYATLFYAVYDKVSQKLTYAVAGHPPALVIRPSTQEIFKLFGTGGIVGIFRNKNDSYQEQEFALQPQDKVLFYTDGLVEIANAQSDYFGLNRLKALLKEHCQLPIEALLKEICTQVLAYSEKSTFDDDVTLVGLEVLGSEV
ncbi:SpoIIE family protein phosphatase [Deltaproteobacteria bacterium TL4]